MHPLVLRVARKAGPIFWPLASRLPLLQKVNRLGVNGPGVDGSWVNRLGVNRSRVNRLGVNRPAVDGLDPKEWAGFLAMVALLSFLYLLFTALLFLSPMHALLFAITGSALLTDLLSFLPAYQKSRKIERLEDAAPSAVDMLVAQYRTKNVYSAFSEAGRHGPLGKYFQEIYAGLRAGVEPRFLFRGLCVSKYLDRISQLLYLMVEKGIDTTEQLLEISEDMIEERHIHKKKRLMVSRDALLLFTVFCFVLPFIFAMSADIVQIFSEILPGQRAGQIQMLRNVLLASIPLNAYFLSLVLGELLRDDSRQGFLYFPLLTSVAVTVFLVSHRALSWLYGF